MRETDKVLPEGNSETVIQQTSGQTTTGTGMPAATRSTTQRSTALSSVAALAASPTPAALNATASTTERRSTVREAAYVIANPETGNVSVRATQSQHAKVREFLDRVAGDEAELAAYLKGLAPDTPLPTPVSVPFFDNSGPVPTFRRIA